jgi:hypothetical protein
MTFGGIFSEINLDSPIIDEIQIVHFLYHGYLEEEKINDT